MEIISFFLTDRYRGRGIEIWLSRILQHVLQENKDYKLDQENNDDLIFPNNSINSLLTVIGIMIIIMLVLAVFFFSFSFGFSLSIHLFIYEFISSILKAK